MSKFNSSKAISVLSLALILIAAFLLPRVWADDAVEALAPGEISFEKTPDIIMQDETLTITKTGKSFTDQDYSVDVDFHFKNISDYDITRKIAFALPPVRCNMETNAMWEGLESKDPNEKGLKDFTVTVDGKDVPFTPRVEAMVGERNVTELLSRYKVPLNPCQVKQKPDGSYDPQYSDILKTNGLITQDNEPAWREDIYYEWTQTFPAGQVIAIHHHYTPIVGSTVPAPRSIADLNGSYNDTIPANYLWIRNLATLAETNPAIIYKNNDPNASDHTQRFCLTPSWVLYRLTTGAFWNGGIGDFKLVVKDNTGTPFAVNEFYNPADPVQTFMAGNSMTITINNFVPTKDLLVLFLSLPQTSQDLKTCGI